MGIEVRGFVPPTSLEQLADGVAFVAQFGDGQMFGMKASNEHGSIVVIFGTVGTEKDDEGAGSAQAFGFDLNPVFPLPGAYIDLVRDQFGVARPETGNGAIWYDSEGVAFIGVKPPSGSGRVMVTLTGEISSMGHGGTAYVDWDLVWTPPGSDPTKDKVVVFKHRKQAR